MAQKRILSGLPYEVGEYVYIIKCGKYYKIGRTKRMGARMVNYKVHNPYPIKLVYYKNCKSSKETEKMLHCELSDYRYKGEWFVLTKDQIKEIVNFIEKYG